MATKTKADPKKKPTSYAPLPCGTVLMALDVSSSATGIAIGEIGHEGLIVHSFGVAKPPSGWPFDRKVDFMSAEIDRLIALYRVSHVAMEFQDHRSTSMRVQGLAVLGQAQGAVWSRLCNRMPVDRVNVRDATKLHGRNVKKQTRCEHIKAMVPAYAERLAADPKFDPGMDSSDAIFLLILRLNQDGKA